MSRNHVAHPFTRLSNSLPAEYHTTARRDAESVLLQLSEILSRTAPHRRDFTCPLAYEQHAHVHASRMLAVNEMIEQLRLEARLITASRDTLLSR